MAEPSEKIRGPISLDQWQAGLPFIEKKPIIVNALCMIEGKLKFVHGPEYSTDINLGIFSSFSGLKTSPVYYLKSLLAD